MTYTVSTLEVSASAYNEIADKLREAGYHQCFDEAGMIDMTHIGLVKAAEPDGFRDVVIEGLAVSHSLTAEHETNPRKAVADLISWHVQVALDPAVSSQAQALIERGAASHGSTIRQGDSMPYAVSNDLYWRYDAAPRGVKLFLLSVGGVAVSPGPWRDGAGFIGWRELFKRDKEQEERLGIR